MDSVYIVVKSDIDPMDSMMVFASEDEADAFADWYRREYGECEVLPSEPVWPSAANCRLFCYGEDSEEVQR